METLKSLNSEVTLTIFVNYVKDNGTSVSISISEGGSQTVRILYILSG